MLVETSGFLCLHEKSETHHEKAIECYDLAELRVTTNYILADAKSP